MMVVMVAEVVAMISKEACSGFCLFGLWSLLSVTYCGKTEQVEGADYDK